MSRPIIVFLTIFVLAAVAGCGDNVVPSQPDANTTAGADAGGTASDAGSTLDAPGTTGAYQFVVEIENLSSTTPLPTPFSPGAWVTHPSSLTLFEADAVDRGQGLQALAEDGSPGGLVTTLAGVAPFTAVFDTPDGSGTAGPIAPGQKYEFTIMAENDDDVLSLATMLVESNDLFVAAEPTGIPLFDTEGKPLAQRDVTDLLRIWDLGTEANQAPRMGPDQAPRQAAGNTGAGEGTIRAFDGATRALPVAQQLADIAVTEAAGTYTITVTNTSEDNHSSTELSHLCNVNHNSGFSLFTEGAATRFAGLESLAEDGDGDPLRTAASVSGDTSQVGLAAKPAEPGETFTFTVTPTAAFPLVSIATMVATSNDAFLAFPPGGVALLDSNNDLRPAADIQAEMNRVLTVWDAGTEANQTPGAGSDQIAINGAPNTGPADSDDTVRRYIDDANDLPTVAGSFLDISITHIASNEFEISIDNDSDTSSYVGAISPVLWVAHEGPPKTFDPALPASSALEALAEIGNAVPLRDAMRATLRVGDSEIVGGADAGTNLTFRVTLDNLNRFLNLASMIVPSNDTFWSLGPVGIELIDSSGSPRDQASIDADIAALLSVWDAGTERNEAGAIGAAQAPRATTTDAGESEGNGQVRILDDSVWHYPALNQLIRVTIRPVDQ